MKHYYLRQQKELTNPCFSAIYLTQDFKPTSFIHKAHRFTEEELLSVPDKLQDSFTVVPENKLVIKLGVANHDGLASIQYTKHRQVC